MLLVLSVSFSPLKLRGNKRWIKWPQGLHIRCTEYQIFILWFIPIAKLQLLSINKNNFMVAGQHNMRSCTKGSLGGLECTGMSHCLKQRLRWWDDHGLFCLFYIQHNYWFSPKILYTILCNVPGIEFQSGRICTFEKLNMWDLEHCCESRTNETRINNNRNRVNLLYYLIHSPWSILEKHSSIQHTFLKVFVCVSYN